MKTIRQKEIDKILWEDRGVNSLSYEKNRSLRFEWQQEAKMWPRVGERIIFHGIPKYYILNEELKENCKLLKIGGEYICQSIDINGNIDFCLKGIKGRFPSSCFSKECNI